MQMKKHIDGPIIIPPVLPASNANFEKMRKRQRERAIYSLLGKIAILITLYFIWKIS